MYQMCAQNEVQESKNLIGLYSNI